MAPVRKRKAAVALQDGVSGTATGGAKRKKTRKGGPAKSQPATELQQLEAGSIAAAAAAAAPAAPAANPAENNAAAKAADDDAALDATATPSASSSSSAAAAAPAPAPASAAVSGESSGSPADSANTKHQQTPSKAEGEGAEAAATSKKAKKKASKQASLEDGQKEDRRGIIHMASVPTYMNHLKLRHLLTQYGEVERIYLKPEDAYEAKKRKRMGGCSKPIFVEGWVEFADRKVARRVAETLNGNTVGGKKRNNFWRDTMWNMRYLPKFKWHQLKEGEVYNRQVRKARLTQKLEQARRENSAFLEQVERAKTREHIIKKKGGDLKAEAAEKARNEGKGAEKGKGKGKSSSKGKGKGKGKGKKGSFPQVDKTGAISDSLLTSLFS